MLSSYVVLIVVLKVVLSIVLIVLLIFHSMDHPFKKRGPLKVGLNCWTLDILSTITAGILIYSLF